MQRVARARIALIRVGSVLAPALLQIVGMADIKCAVSALDHIGPERHRPGKEEREGFDKLSPNRVENIGANVEVRFGLSLSKPSLPFCLRTR